MSSKGKAIADPKGKRKIDDDKTGGRNKKRSGVLQFFEDSAREADESDDSLDSLFGDDEDGGIWSLSLPLPLSLFVSLSPSLYTYACVCVVMYSPSFDLHVVLCESIWIN